MGWDKASESYDHVLTTIPHLIPFVEPPFVDQILYELLDNNVVQEAINRKDKLVPGIFVDFSPDKFLSLPGCEESSEVNLTPNAWFISPK